MITAIENTFSADSRVSGALITPGLKKLRIMIDARKIYDGGIGVYTQNLIQGLLDTHETELTLLVKPGESIPESWIDLVKVVEDPAKPYSIDELWKLSKRLDFSNIDIFHAPHYMLPYNMPVPAVVTVHDLIHIKQPEKKYYPWIARPLIKSALKRAARILTVSNASNKDIRELVNSREKIVSKIRVVPNAVDKFFIEKSALPVTSAAQGKHKINGRYLLSIFSNLKPHKGMKDLLLAFQIAQKQFKDIKLVIVGFGTESLVGNNELLELTSSTRGLNIIGKVSKEELAELYRNAEALVVPSLAEGFYLPIIEAQAMGTDIITRPVPATLELIRESDYVSRDFTVEALAEQICRRMEKISDAEAVSSLNNSGLISHLKKYDQLSLAKTVLQIYKEALSESR